MYSLTLMKQSSFGSRQTTVVVTELAVFAVCVSVLGSRMESAAGVSFRYLRAETCWRKNSE
jgi:hypothetical protein